MLVVNFFLMLLGLLCFLASAVNRDVRGLNLTALGLFFWILVPLLNTLGRLL